ncbi:hypothetical protein E3N88_09484 [Mikania micrantha]|uniref:Uncharacterized protein n=1 Tax=Mikania micrantha TaxID=192012 RepID=A0A5N6PK32_9ASTR|nr:hypothetical protein E3N88_09484 [Mikania micrantha]
MAGVLVWSWRWGFPDVAGSWFGGQLETLRHQGIHACHMFYCVGNTFHWSGISWAAFFLWGGYCWHGLGGLQSLLGQKDGSPFGFWNCMWVGWLFLHGGFFFPLNGMSWLAVGVCCIGHGTNLDGQAILLIGNNPIQRMLRFLWSNWALVVCSWARSFKWALGLHLLGLICWAALDIGLSDILCWAPYILVWTIDLVWAKIFVWASPCVVASLCWAGFPLRWAWRGPIWANMGIWVGLGSVGGWSPMGAVLSCL